MTTIDFNLVQPTGDWQIQYTIQKNIEYKSFTVTSDTLSSLKKLFKDDIERWERYGYRLNVAILVYPDGTRERL